MVIDGHEQQKQGSLAARFERLLDLYAPVTDTGRFDEYGEPILVRDPSGGVITKEEFIRLLNAC